MNLEVSCPAKAFYKFELTDQGSESLISISSAKRKKVDIDLRYESTEMVN
jgi:hypothetical protein